MGLILLLVILIGLTAKPSFRMKAKEPFYSLLNPVQEKFETADSFLISLNEVVVNLNKWQERMERLERARMSLLAENADLRQVEKENKTLRKALDMELQKDFQLKLVRITGKRLEQEQIILNKGRNDGLEKNMPVVGADRIVIGKTIKVGDNTSRVRLISHPETSFSAHLKNKEMEAEIEGQKGFGIRLNFIPSEVKVEKGQVVVTGALGGVYPAGLLVGEIKQVEQRDVKSFQVAEVDPYFKADGDFLFVITEERE